MDFLLRLGDVTKDGDAAVRAYGCTQGAAGTFVLGVEQDYRPISLGIQEIGVPQHIGGTRVATQITSFAALHVYDNSACGHSDSSI